MFSTTTASLEDVLARNEENILINEIDNQFLGDYDEFKGGNTLFKTIPNKTSFQNLITRSKVISQNDPIHQEWRPLFHDITDNILTTDTQLSFSEAMQKAYTLHKVLDGKLYGILLINKDLDIRINPFHPLTAMSIVNDDFMSSHVNFTMAIYTYTTKDSLDDFYDSSNVNHDIIEENLVDLINCYIARTPTKVDVIEKQFNRASRQVEVKYRIAKDKEEDVDKSVYIVTHQLLTAGTIAPYYGTSVIIHSHTEQGTRVTGMNISPMLSSNIKHNNSDDHYTHSGNIASVVQNYSSVCTGSEDNKTAHGLRTLTHSNTKSPYTSTIIQSGALPYVEACITKSLAIYKLAKLIKETDDAQPSDNPESQD